MYVGVMKNFTVKGLLAGAVVTTAAVASLSACSSGPANGYVWAKQYSPASEWYVPGYWVSGSCTQYGSKYTSCTGGYYTPGYWDYAPEEWQVRVCSNKIPVSKNNNCGWKDVDQQTYHSLKLNDYLQTTAVVPTPTDVKKKHK